MRLTVDIKALCLRAMIGCVVLSTNAVASSVEIIVDAALDEVSLQIAGEVSMQIARAAGDEHSVGIVVYDEVFQRSSENTVADQVNVERISRLFESIVPSEFSNISVGIEKGISELDDEGGVLLVFGHSEILLADDVSAAKYSDWLELVLLPDAASKSINTVLAIPQTAQSSSLNSIFQKYPNNTVISFDDTSEVIGQLSTILPFNLAVFAPSAEAESATIESIPEKDVAPLAVGAAVEQGEAMSSELLVLFLLLAFLLVLAVAVTICMLKRKRGDRHAEEHGSLAAATPCRYLAPKRGMATVLTPHAADATENATLEVPKTRASHQVSDPDQCDGVGVGESGESTETLESELDVTAPRRLVQSDAATKIAASDVTVRRVAKTAEASSVPVDARVIDELEELRNVTQLKHEILN